MVLNVSELIIENMSLTIGRQSRQGFATSFSQLAISPREVVEKQFSAKVPFERCYPC